MRDGHVLYVVCMLPGMTASPSVEEISKRPYWPSNIKTFRTFCINKVFPGNAKTLNQEASSMKNKK